MAYPIDSCADRQEELLSSEFEGDWNLADYPTFKYSQTDVKKAGELLGSKLVIPDGDNDALEEARWAFRVGYNWRDSHIFPMRRIASELSGKVRSGGKSGFSYARVKRMESIRLKLSTTTNKLNQIQDLGGCRAVMESIGDCRKLIKLYEEGASIHPVRNTAPYMDKPRESGYRSHHIVLEYAGELGIEQYRGRRIEIQIRTALQHAWATALEAVGLIRNENLKAGKGDADWLRLFALMSAEFSAAENEAPVPNVPENSRERHKEIIDLESKLKASQFLRQINNTIQVASIDQSGAQYYLIEADTEARSMSITPIKVAAIAAGEYDKAEQFSKKPGKISVLVSVSMIGDLIMAFPNYFMDVSTFGNSLSSITSPYDGRRLVPVTFPKKKVTSEVKSSLVSDLSWLRGYQGQLKKIRRNRHR